MLKNVKSVLVLLFVFICSASVVLAADQQRDRKQLKDGTCQEPVIIKDNAALVLAADQQRDRKQLKDGTCQEPVIIKNDTGLIFG